MYASRQAAESLGAFSDVSISEEASQGYDGGERRDSDYAVDQAGPADSVASLFPGHANGESASPRQSTSSTYAYSATPLASPTLPQESSAPVGQRSADFAVAIPGFGGGGGAAFNPTDAYPPLKQTMQRIRNHLEQRCPELLDTLSYPAVPGALNRLERKINGLSGPNPFPDRTRRAQHPYPDMNGNYVPNRHHQYQLPPPVRDCYALHDGQDVESTLSITGSSLSGASGGVRRGAGESFGLVWGLWWMSSEEVQEEWEAWRRLEDRDRDLGYQYRQRGEIGANELHEAERRAIGAAATSPDEDASMSDLIDPFLSMSVGSPGLKSSMTSLPVGWVRQEYSHPGWIPLLTDRVGNYIGIDLDPPPPVPEAKDGSQSEHSANAAPPGQGLPGQVIAFGREMDEKVVLFRCEGQGGWGRFLASFAEDLENGEFGYFGDASGRRARTDGGSSDEDDDDGIGDLGYFDDPYAAAEVMLDDSVASRKAEYGRSGRQNGLPTHTSSQQQEKVLRPSAGNGRGGWRLRGHYRSMSIIEALCERSRRRWRDAGFVAKMASAVASGGDKAKSKAHVTDDVDASTRESQADGAASTSKTRPANESTPSKERSPPPVSLLLSPPPPDEPFSSNTNASASTSSTGDLAPPNVHRPKRTASSPSPSDQSSATGGLVRKGTPHHNVPTAAARRRPRPPPPPVPILLPTMADLFEEGSTAISPLDGAFAGSARYDVYNGSQRRDDFQMSDIRPQGGIRTPSDRVAVVSHDRSGSSGPGGGVGAGGDIGSAKLSSVPRGGHMSRGSSTGGSVSDYADAIGSPLASPM